MNDFEVVLYGLHTTHEKDFFIERRQGTPEWLLMCFDTPFQILTDDGIKEGKKGDCIIMAPNMPQFHGPVEQAETGFVNSWFHCNGKLIAPMVKEYALPVNTIVKTANSAFFHYYLNEIMSENFHRKELYKKRMRLLFEEILLHISRENKNYLNNHILIIPHFEALNNIREAMLINYKENWSIKRLSDRVNLSESRFYSLYKAAFNISPIEDLLDKRINEAKIMLISTDKTIEQIAYECGFSSLYYFSKIFKERSGVSPRKYRK